AWGASRSPLLDVDHVRLTGATHTQLWKIIQTAGPLPGRPMVDVDEAAAAHRIERLPWVADARVRRRWPNTVTIQVRERAPAASVPAAAGGRRGAPGGHGPAGAQAGRGGSRAGRRRRPSRRGARRARARHASLDSPLMAGLASRPSPEVDITVDLKLRLRVCPR